MNKLIFNILDKFSGETNAEKRLKIFDAIYLYEKNGEKTDFDDVVFSSLMEFIYIEIDKLKNEIQNEIKRNSNENTNIVFDKSYSGVSGNNIVLKNENQNEIPLLINENQNEIQTKKKRGCPKGTKKPNLIGNNYAKKRNSNEKNEIQNEIQFEPLLEQNEISSNENQLVIKNTEISKNENNENQNEIPLSDVEVIEDEQENEFFISAEIEDSNVNDIEKRKLSFGKKIGQFVDEYGKDMCRDFYNYWTEKNENGRKMRFEKERTFEIKKRLVRWKLNQNKYKNGENRQFISTYEQRRNDVFKEDARNFIEYAIQQGKI